MGKVDHMMSQVYNYKIRFQFLLLDEEKGKITF